MRHAVIMAGGSGTRLWPLSRAERPKQLLDVVAGAGRRRAQPARRGVRPAASGAARRPDLGVHRGALRRPGAGRPAASCGADRLILEPVARDTANAVGLTAALVADVDPDAELAVVSADHVIRPVERFAATLRDRLRRPRRAARLAGHARDHPDVAGHRLRLRAARRADRGARGGRGRRVPGEARPGDRRGLPGVGGVPLELRHVRLAGADRARRARRPPAGDGRGAARGSWPPRPGPERDAVLAEVFPTLPKISVDYAVLEPAATEPGRVLVADLDVDWLDVGSWPALAHTLDVDAAGNAVRGLTVVLDGSGNIVLSDDPDAPRRAGRRARQRGGAHRRRDDGLPGRRRRAGQAAARRRRGAARPPVQLSGTG